MKKHRRTAVAWALLLLGMALPAAAQDRERPRPEEVGFVRLINLVAVGEGTTKIIMDGKNRWPRGFQLGQRTGGIGMKYGSHEFVLKKDGCKGAKRKVDVAPGKTQTLVAYAEPVRDETGEIVEWELKIARLSQHTPEKGMFVTIVSFCEAKELPLQIHETMSDTKLTAVAKRLGTVRLPMPGGEVRALITHGEDDIMTLKAEEDGNYVVMIYEDGEGGYEAISFYDPKFVLAN